MKKEISGSELAKMAKRASKNAYSPFSKLKVGAALITKKGNIFLGCNVENSSYGLTICAERNAIFSAINAEGPTMKIKKIAAIIDNNSPGAPCGACRQVIAEFSDNDTEVIFIDNIKLNSLTIDEILPHRFRLKLK